MTTLDNNIIVAMSNAFFKKLNTLPSKVRRKVNSTIQNFRANPTAGGLNFERIDSASDPNFRSIRVNNDYRIIVNHPDEGNVYLFCWIDKHDDAYKWATRKRVKVNPQTGGVQIFEESVVTVPPEESTSVSSPVTSTETTSTPEPEILPPMFESYADEDLITLGAPLEQIGLLRTLCSVKDLVNVQAQLPEEVFEALQLLHEGFSVADVVDALHVEKPSSKQEQFDVHDVAAALERASSKRTFWVPDSEKKLAEMLEAPLEQWRIFLHPSQRKYVEKDLNGPGRVLGGAGTGKTVVAMHRAVYLAQKAFTNPNERILFTTFTKNLAHDIQTALQSLAEPDVLNRIEVIHLDGWVSQFLKRQNYQYKVAYYGDKSGTNLKKLWKDALLKGTDPSFSEGFYREEWEQVVQYHGIDSYQAYSRVRRTGRGSRLSKAQRFAVWQVFEEYRNLLEENSVREHIDAIRDARVILNKNPMLRPFVSVIVDEGQDISPEGYRLLRAMVPEGKNDMFIVGDGHQRIYKYTVVLSRCNINIVGRSYRLRLNYRTTEEIRKFAVGMLNGVKVANLDGGEDELKGYTSLMHGEAPLVKHFSSFTDEVTYLKGVLQDENFGLNRTCLVARSQQTLDRYVKELEKAGVKTHQIRRSTANRAETLSVATMHRVKGLEFDRVLVVGLSKDQMPFSTALNMADDSIAKAAAEVRERCLFYVALTRAKQQVTITASGVPSPFIQ